MRSQQLQQRYPRMWKSVYDMVLDDVKMAFDPIRRKANSMDMREFNKEFSAAQMRVAHNAAFIAASTLHTMVTKEDA